MPRSRWLLWLLGPALSLALVPLTMSGGASYAASARLHSPDLSYSFGSVIEFAVLRRADARLTLHDDDGVPFREDGDTYDFQVSRTPMRAAHRSAWRTVATGSDLGHRRLHVATGRVLCVRARLHRDGRTSAWSQRQCVVQPLADERLQRRGPMRVRPDHHFVDRHSTVLRTGGRLLLPGVPRGASYGPVYVDNGVLNDGHDQPEWWILGHRHLYQSAIGGFNGELMWNAKVAREPGTAVVTTDSPFALPIGGVVVLPSWL
jgi:hypothetical protein